MPALLSAALKSSTAATAALASGASAMAASNTAIPYGLRVTPSAMNFAHSLARWSAGIASHARRMASVSTNESTPAFTPHATVWWNTMGRRPPRSS